MPEQPSAGPGLEVPADFAHRLIGWQRDHGRHGLPWQNTRDPYRVWLSEVMLQQTQVATVLGYYERFLARFPDVAALAAAPLDAVLAAWSGLGYYRRARYLHAAAQAVVEQHAGRFPTNSAGLMTLPGVGRSTAAAIAAFCFGERVAILDGNVKRVLSRVLGFDADLADAGAERALWALATELLPDTGIERYTQGLMDLGATLCTARSPSCLLCPERDLCAAARAGTQEHHPVKSKRLIRGTRAHHWLWLSDPEDAVWLVQRPEQGVWAGLWSLPEFAGRPELDACAAAWPGRAEAAPAFTHVLTHFDWALTPVRWRLPRSHATGTPDVAELRRRWPTGRWFAHDAALAAALPSPLRKLLLRQGGRPAVPQATGSSSATTP